MTSLTLLGLICLVACVYASVGHGGASGYLAVMSLLAYEPLRMSSAALVLNLFVSGIACWTFWRAGFGSFGLFWPFAVASVPAAFLGGLLRIPPQVYGWLLAFALLAAALRLVMTLPSNSEATQHPSRITAGLAGSGIGLLSGIVGVGGGIFLSPLMVLMRWASVKQTAAISAAFILVNSLSGLAARATTGRLYVEELSPPIAAAMAGGLLGARFGAHWASSIWLRRMLAVVLLVASAKLIFRHG